MENIIDNEILKDNKNLEIYIFDYIEENKNIILDRNILICLDYLGYKWKWNENEMKISNICKGKNKNIKIIKIDDCIDETMDIETKDTHSYKVNSLISHNTINLPKNTTKEEVSEVYINAYKKRIIGVTIYREGSREGILVNNNDNERGDRIVKSKAPKRPYELPAEMHHVIYEKQRYYVAIGLLHNEPYEVFTGLNHNEEGDIYIPKEIKEGRIIKGKSRTYSFKNGNNIEYILHGYHHEDTAEALTRQISLSLRHGTSINWVIEQLQKNKSNSNLYSYTKILARILKKYIPDGCVSTKCSNCGNTLVYESGCVICKVCGYSACS